MLGPLTYGALRSGGAGAASYPLDSYDNIRAAYSVRRLLSSYEGSALRIRRSSDNNEQDFGFDNGGDLDTAAISTFIGGGSGFVVTWYDQSGNGHNVSNGTAANQPLYSASEIDIGGRPAVSFDKASFESLFVTGRTIPLPSVTLFAFVSLDTLDNNLGVVSVSATGANDFNNADGFIWQQMSTGHRLIRNVGANALDTGTIAQAADTYFLATLRFSAGNAVVRANGAEVDSDTYSDTTQIDANRIAISARFSSSLGLYASNTFAEIILFGVGLPDEQMEAIEANMSTYYE